MEKMIKRVSVGLFGLICVLLSGFLLSYHVYAIFNGLEGLSELESFKAGFVFTAGVIILKLTITGEHF